MDLSLLWGLRKPVLWIGRQLLKVVGAWTVAPIYRQAHAYHCALRNWQRRWIEMADGVEYKLYTRSSFDADDGAEQFIIIRNSGTATIDEIRFCVEAGTGSVGFQVPLAACQLRPNCKVVLSLAGLPCEDLRVQKDGIFASYESIRVYPSQITRGQQLEVYATRGVAWHPTHDDFLNGEWRRWDGKLLNVKAIKDARQDLFVKLAYHLCGRHGLHVFEAGTLCARAIRRRQWARLPGVLAFGLLTATPVLHAIHWTRLLLRIERIVFEDDDGMRAAAEYVMLKGESAGPVRVMPA